MPCSRGVVPLSTRVPVRPRPGRVAVRETDRRRTVENEHVCGLGPRVGVPEQGRNTGIIVRLGLLARVGELKRAELNEEPKQRGRAGTSV